MNRLTYLLSACALSVLVPPLAAQAQNDNTIRAIRVDGVERIDPVTVRSYLTVQPGDSFTPENLDASLKKLFATGLFANVNLARDGGVLVVKVQENPVINQVTFEGNDALSTEDLNKEIQLRPRSVFTRTKVQEDTQRILDLYRRNARFGAEVTPRIEELAQNRVNLIFEIQEGDKTKISRISFVGNRAFSASRLREALATKESAWYRLLSTSDVYDPDRVNYDEELLRQFYLEQGYADFRVVSSVAELSRDKRAFFITFTVDEGERYRVRTAQVVSDIPRVKASDLAPVSRITAGEWFNGKDMDRTIQLMTERLGNLGYAFAQVNPDIKKNKDGHTLDITFRIAESARVFVERINITGNVRTLDRVIRREFPLAEGDAFNAEKLKLAERNLRNLNFFRTVKVEAVPGSTPDRTIINVAVEEQSTGELSFGAGFSSTDSLLGDVRLRERNFLGRGQDVQVSTTVSGRRQEFDLGYTEPYFMDTNVTAGVDLFRITREFQDFSSYDEQRTGGSLRAGYKITDNLSQTWRYTLRQVNIGNVDPNASRFIRDQAGTNLTSSIGQDLLYDRRDNALLPNEGYFIRYGIELAGLGGDTNFARNELSTGVYIPVARDDWVASVETKAGYVTGWGGQNVRIPDRFFIGGDSFPGFELAGIGPRDRSTTDEDALGGNLYFVSTAELRFPLGLPEELGVTGRTFFNAGTLSQTDDSGAGIVDSGSIRTSAGVGLAWQSPFGPVRIDLAQAISKEDYDKTEIFRFSFGTQF